MPVPVQLHPASTSLETKLARVIKSTRVDVRGMWILVEIKAEMISNYSMICSSVF